jgi:inorganic phosphate transporter, PiT family
MTLILAILLLTIVLSLIFEFTNGFHDTANCVSTVIATKVLKPFVAIVLASLLNMIGATQISKVAQTITSGLVPVSNLAQGVVLAALIGAIFWNLLTWYFGLPSSSSYALIGGLLGAGAKAYGIQNLYWLNFLYKVIIPMIVSPLVGFFLCFFVMKLIFKKVNPDPSSGKYHIFGKLQVLSSSFVALSHGFNDAQKTMAIITLALFAAGKIPTLSIPIWVIIVCALVMALGTMVGGYRIIKTVGYKITKLTPLQGFVSETGASMLICTASVLGYPLSTTHLIVGSVGGVGASKGLKKVSSHVITRIVLAWLFTFPGAFVIAMFSYHFLNHFKS